jgi:hypothetical protein
MSALEVIDTLVGEILRLRIANKKTIVGCTDQQMQEIEAVHGRPLPAMYDAFMRRMGKGAGHLFRGTEIFYPEILDLREAAQELFLENHIKTPVSPEWVVFSMHQGYQFLFFDQRTADPPVRWYFEGKGISQMSDSFSAFLAQEVAEHGGLVARGVLKPQL